MHVISSLVRRRGHDALKLNRRESASMKLVRRRGALNSPHRLLGSGTGSSNMSTSKDNKPLPFPWRHSHTLLPRIELESYRINKDWRSRFFVALWERSTGLIMDKPVAELVGRQWRKDLADESAWAFSFGVAALLSNIFKVPMEDIVLRRGEEIEVRFSYTTPFTRDTGTNNNDTASFGNTFRENEALSSTREAEGEPDATTTTDQPQNPFYDEVDQLFEEGIVELFESFHNKYHSAATAQQQSTPTVEITLTLKPVDAELHKVFCFPFLSRSAVTENESRKKEYMVMLDKVRHEGAGAFYSAFWAFADRMLAERGMMQTTIMADVLIECSECFQVKDVSTNEILQGDGLERTVQHLVRMEIDSSFVQEDNNEYWSKGHWKIADIDDHLVGRGLWAPI